jgi:PAS domain S-box-containing protein
MAHHKPEEGGGLGTTGKRGSDQPARAGRGDAHRMRRAARLREGGEQFRLAQEALGIVTWVWDVRTDRVQWHGNPAALLGLERGAFSGRFAEYLACLHPEDLERAKQTYVDCLQGRRPEYRAVERVIWPDGSLHWLETYGRAEQGPDGRARRMMGVIKDVSERKREEAARLKAEGLLSHVFEASPDYIVVARAGDGRFVAVNAAFERATGYAAERVIGSTAEDLGIWAQPGERRRWLAELRRQGGSLQDWPIELRASGGALLSGTMSTSLIDHDGDQLVICIVHDLTEIKGLERHARQSRHKYEALFAHSPNAIAIARRRDSVMLEVNAAWERATGYARHDAVGRSALELRMWCDPDARPALIRSIETQGAVSNFPTRFQRRDGVEIDVLLSGATVDLDGESCVVWSWSDVTEQRRTEREHAAADARYRRLFESAREGMFITAPDHTVLDVNPAGCELTGYAAREIVGRSAAMLYSEEDMRRQPFRTDLAVRWRSVERVMARRDGRRMDVEVAAGPMPDGNVLAIVRDITERKRSETLLMNVARGVSAEMGGAFFRSLVEHLARELGADYAFIGELAGADSDRVRTLAFVGDGSIVENAEYRLAGSPCINAITQRGTVVYPERVAELFPEDLGLARRGIQAYVGTSLTGANGAALGVLVVMHRQPVQRGAYWASMIEIFAARAAAEIERARAEALVLRTNASLEEAVRERTAQLEEANRELESYNFSISHDLRQPLNAISGFSELLRESDGSGGGNPQEYVREIESNAARMEQMIEALLQLSRAGRGALRREGIDVRAMVGDVVRELPGGAAAVQVGELPGVRADPVLLRQVWSNLVGNALKYSRRSAAPRVQVGGERRGGRVEYFVRDNGVGFDMRHARRLFTAFQRLPSAADYEGTGVGLAIVERIVRRHGGSIAGQAEPGRGATFRFSLPDEAL